MVKRKSKTSEYALHVEVAVGNDPDYLQLDFTFGPIGNLILFPMKQAEEFAGMILEAARLEKIKRAGVPAEMIQ